MSSVYILLPLSLLCYIIFFLSICKAWKKDRKKVFAQSNRAQDISTARNLQITGILLFGFFTGIVRMRQQMTFLSFPKDPDNYLMLLTAILFVIVFIISWFTAQKNKLSDKYSYLLRSSSQRVANYFLFRVLFLVAYEFFFRGVLLFDIAMMAGITISISINIIMYVILHLFDNRQTIIGAVPFGLLLCWLSWETQSIWPAVVLHLVLALTYEIKISYSLFQSPKKIIT
jgi:membrane protease YdiL (CAAX protease family)